VKRREGKGGGVGREIGGSRTRQRKGAEGKKEKKERKNNEHARDPNANRSNKVNPIQFLHIIVWLYITPSHHQKQVEKERKPQDSQKSKKKVVNEKKS